MDGGWMDGWLAQEGDPVGGGEVLQELGYLPCALSYELVFSSDSGSISLGGSEKIGDVIWIMVSTPEMDRKYTPCQ